MKQVEPSQELYSRNDKNVNQVGQSIDHIIKKTGSHLPPRPDSMKYNRQQSIIDGLTQNRVISSTSNASINRSITVVETEYYIMSKSPSIEQLLHEQESKSQNPLVRKIEDIFVNKATLSSKQINSSMLLNNINEPLFIPKQPQELTSYLNKSPTKSNNSKNNSYAMQNFVNSPDKSSSSKPFLRRKSSEKISQNPQLAAMHKQNLNRQNESRFDIKNVNTNISNLKSYNYKLQRVLQNLEEIRRSGRLDNEMDFRLKGETDLEVLKFMVEKAILRKDEDIV